ncbi:IS91 family transposase [Pseudochryseolinea flava]|uniref:IS91 family transposase n=1 Tax=Pseudochryseolinea flava TaxID=2059302 RepID=UPI001FE99C92|nr:IS91 family transposase [Pseudochryseolinea flava]
MNVTPATLQQTVFDHPAITSFNTYSQAVFRKLKECHTIALGYHRLKCDDQHCNHLHWQYHSCGNRHCPACGSWKKEQWIDFKMAELLPTAYYHVVFTLPHEMNKLIMVHRKELFKLLFDASAHTLLILGKDPKYLGAEIGCTSILHTWGQDLSFHPHVHCIVSAGGVKENKWIEEKRKNNKFVFPVGAMQKIFKGYFLQKLRRMFNNKKINIDYHLFHNLITTIGYKKWNVYAKKPFGGPAQVIQYLGRYTHKVAITHHRVISIDKDSITFRYKDYSDGDKQKVMTLSQHEFVRRFEQHILPKGFVKIRSYGFLKHFNKNSRLNALRKSMNISPAPPKVVLPVRLRILERYGKDIARCPKCLRGTMVLIETLRPRYDWKILQQQNYATKINAP